MIDNFALVLTHGLLAIALVRLMLRRDLDHDVAADSAGEDPPTQRRRGSSGAPPRRPGDA